jgi:hypothetical protein
MMIMDWHRARAEYDTCVAAGTHAEVGERGIQPCETCGWMSTSFPTARDVLKYFDGRQIDARGFLISEINGRLAAVGLKDHVHGFDKNNQPIIIGDYGPDSPITKFKRVWGEAA